MERISSNAKYVWVKSEKYQVVPGSVNQVSRCLNAFCGDYQRMGNPCCFTFDEIEKVEY